MNSRKAAIAAKTKEHRMVKRFAIYSRTAFIEKVVTANTYATQLSYKRTHETDGN